LRPAAYLVADVVVYYLMTLLGVVLLFVVGRLAYHVQFDGNVLSVAAAFTLGTLSFFALGFLVAGLSPSARVAQTIGMVGGFPMMFLSGAGMPLELLPENVRSISRYLPLTYVVKLLRGLWFGEPWGEHLTEVAVLLGVLIVSTIIAARTFRWE
jgi:ABC-2 type transport system permease protein